MTNLRMILVGCGVLLATALVARWPRLDAEMVTVTRSEVQGDHLSVEYRMSRPFKVSLQHRIRKLIDSPAEGKKDVADLIPSAFDWLRGEHFVRIDLERGPSLSIDANGRRSKIGPWSAPDASRVQWLPPGEHFRFGNGNGNAIVSIASSPEEEEVLMLVAGTDIGT